MARKDRLSKYSETNNPVEEQKSQLEDMSITDKWKEKQKKPRMEDTHMRTSFLFRKDYKARLDKLSDYYGRGYRTHFLNNAIAKALEVAEEELKGEL